MPAELDELNRLMPFAADLGISLEEASAERVVAMLPWAPRLCTSGGIHARGRADVAG
jgi:acyl-coenzyme A thioesterase PaaI-like protein